MDSIIYNTELSTQKRDEKVRLYYDGRWPEGVGANVGSRFFVRFEDWGVSLHFDEEGKNTVSYKKKSGGLIPVIDICPKELTQIFQDVDRIEVRFYADRVEMRIFDDELARVERVKAFMADMAEGNTLAAASAFHGFGLLDRAIHEGFGMAGLDLQLKAAFEYDEKIIEAAAEHNPTWTAQTVGFNMRVQKVATDILKSLGRVTLFSAGIPCVGASKAGRASNQISMAEQHPTAGALFFTTLKMVEIMNPLVCVFENVPEYQDTASMEIIRSLLSTRGYDVHETVLNANDHGCLERRKRLCVVAVTKGIDFSFESLETLAQKPATIAEVLDDVAADSDKWATFDYLKTKQVRDAAKGNGFKMQVFGPESEYVGTLRSGYHKGGSTDPLFPHPENPEKLRKFTAAEHAAMKGWEKDIVEKMSETLGHIVLGNGVARWPFVAVGKAIAQSLKVLAAPSGKSTRIDQPRVSRLPLFEMADGQMAFA